jgi:(heptosyl)LPS beta-1,4-glucosyltransferase
MKAGISAIVVVHNQLDLLKQCLDSIYSWVDEIILIDLESNEDIKSLAPQYQAKYILHKKVAIVEEVRQSSLEHAKYEYVLFLDPDETIPVELSLDLREKIENREFDYFVTPRQNYVFGKWVRHSRWWPDLQTRIFRQGHVTWGSKLHEAPVASGNGHIYPVSEKFAIVHTNYHDIDEFISKNMRYAKADALSRIESGDELTIATAIKLSVSELMSRFFASEGYRDGMHGLILAILQSFYYFMVYGYYWEGKKYAELEAESLIKKSPRMWFSHALSETLHWDKASSALKSIKAKLVRRMIA